MYNVIIAWTCGQRYNQKSLLGLKLTQQYSELRKPQTHRCLEKDKNVYRNLQVEQLIYNFACSSNVVSHLGCGRRYSASSSSITTQLTSVKSSPSPQIHLSQVQPCSLFDMSSKHQYTSCGENAIEEGMEKSHKRRTSSFLSLITQSVTGSPPLEDGLRVWFHSRT